MIKRLAQRQLKTKYGIFDEVLYYDGTRESIALTFGEVHGMADLLCRIHSACIGGHVFNSVECQCAAEMAAAQLEIANAGSGIIIYLDQEGKGNGHLALIESIRFKAEFGQAKAYKMAGFSADARDFRPAAEIIHDLGIVSVILLTENSNKAEDLRRHAVNVSGTRPLDIKL